MAEINLSTQRFEKNLLELTDISENRPDGLPFHANNLNKKRLACLFYDSRLIKFRNSSII